jgi:molecular chaperone DnaJ
MAEKRDYYAVLGIPKTASLDDIKKAYRELARKYHPDVTKEDPKVAEERFKEISEAYEVLVDDDKRKMYDQFGHAGVSQQFGPGGFQWSDFTHQGDIRDIFGDLGDFGFGGSLFDMFFGRGIGGRNRGPHQGQSLRYDLEISLEEAAAGGEREIEIPRSVECDACHGTGAKDGKVATCPNCGGRGQISNVQRRGYSQFVTVTACPRCGGSGKLAEARCPKCGGRGVLIKHSKIAMDIPKGAESGMKLRFAGAGDASPDGGPPGDLFVVVHVREHEAFKRDGSDLWIEWPVSFSQAALGADIEVPTIEGKAVLSVPPGTQGSAVLRMKGNGLPRLDGRGKGDQYVRVQIRVPKKLSAEQKQLLKRFEELDASRKGLFDRFKG